MQRSENYRDSTGMAFCIQNPLGLILNHYEFYHVFEQ